MKSVAANSSGKKIAHQRNRLGSSRKQQKKNGQQQRRQRMSVTWAPELVEKKISVKPPPRAHHPKLWFMEREAQVMKAINVKVKPIDYTRPRSAKVGGIERVIGAMPLKVLSISFIIPSAIQLFGETVKQTNKQSPVVKNAPGVITASPSSVANVTAHKERQKDALQQVVFSLEAAAETIDELRDRAAGLPDPTMSVIAADTQREWFTIGYTRPGGECQGLRMDLPPWRYYLRCRFHVVGSSKSNSDNSQRVCEAVNQLIQDGGRLSVNVSYTGVTTQLR